MKPMTNAQKRLAEQAVYLQNKQAEPRTHNQTPEAQLNALIWAAANPYPMKGEKK